MHYGAYFLVMPIFTCHPNIIVPLQIISLSLLVLVSAGDPAGPAASSQSYNSRHQRHQQNRLTTGQHQDLASSGIGEPYFAEDPVGVKNVTAQLGLTTYLHCKVNNLNGKTVSELYNQMENDLKVTGSQLGCHAAGRCRKNVIQISS